MYRFPPLPQSWQPSSSSSALWDPLTVPTGRWAPEQRSCCRSRTSKRRTASFLTKILFRSAARRRRPSSGQRVRLFLLRRRWTARWADGRDSAWLRFWPSSRLWMRAARTAATGTLCWLASRSFWLCRTWASKCFRLLSWKWQFLIRSASACLCQCWQRSRVRTRRRCGTRTVRSWSLRPSSKSRRCRRWHVSWVCEKTLL